MNEQTSRWYMANKDGMVTLCADQADAEQEAKNAQEAWPHMGPHRAVRLVEVGDAGFTAADMATAEARGFREGQFTDDERQFTKKPVTIQAIQWTGKNLREVITFTDGPPDTRSAHAGMAWDAYVDLVARDGLKIYTLEGTMLASPGDWIIRGVKGEMYPCKDEIFEATYSRAALAAPAQQPWQYTPPAQERIDALELEVRQLTEQIAELRHAPTPQADSQPAPLREGEWINDAGRIKWLMWRVQDLEAKLAARAPADSVLEDAARRGVEPR